MGLQSTSNQSTHRELAGRTRQRCQKGRQERFEGLFNHPHARDFRLSSIFFFELATFFLEDFFKPFSLCKERHGSLWINCLDVCCSFSCFCVQVWPIRCGIARWRTFSRRFCPRHLFPEPGKRFSDRGGCFGQTGVVPSRPLSRGKFRPFHWHSNCGRFVMKIVLNPSQFIRFQGLSAISKHFLKHFHHNQTTSGR